MKFILTGAVWIIILSLVAITFNTRSVESEVVDTSEHLNKHQVSIEVTTTFSTEKDPFSFGESAGAFEIILNGETIYQTEDGIKDRIPFMTKPYELTDGLHEIFISGNPSDNTVSQAVRVVILVENNHFDEATYWFSSGESVNASHKFTLETEAQHDDH